MRSQPQEDRYTVCSSGGARTACRWVVTSRPEGVRLHRFAPTHVVMNLKPLSDAQQRQAISAQIMNDTFVAALYGFCETRQMLDEARSPQSSA